MCQGSLKVMWCLCTPGSILPRISALMPKTRLMGRVRMLTGKHQSSPSLAADDALHHQRLTLARIRKRIPLGLAVRVCVPEPTRKCSSRSGTCQPRRDDLAAILFT
jgi:hypothetical protein